MTTSIYFHLYAEDMETGTFFELVVISTVHVHVSSTDVH